MGIDEKIQLVQDVILSSFGNYKKEEVSTHAIGDMVLKMYEEKKQRRLDGDDIITLPIGIKELDSIMGGWQPGTLTVIGGRQGHGKSTLAMDFSFNLILKEHPTLYLTLEQGSVEIFLYHLQKYTTYSPLNIKLGNLSEGDEALLRQAIEKFKKFPLFINDRARTLSDVVTTIRTLHLTESIEVVIIDYLQLIENPGKENQGI